MRCLRCALDYGPEERYCNRCGRGLSRPPGSKNVEGEGDFSALQDTQYLYSTFAPPGQQSTAPQAPAAPLLGRVALPPSMATSERMAQAPLDAPVPTRVALPPPVAMARPAMVEQAEELRAPRISPLARLVPPEDNAVDLVTPSSRSQRAALPGSVYIAPPSAPDAAPWEIQAPQEEMEAPPSTPRIKPATIGIEAGAWRSTSRRQRNLPRIPLRILAAVVILAILGVVSGLALSRHSTYARDLHAGDTLSASGRYAEAIVQYNAAIKVWPFHDAATNGIASAQAEMAAITRNAQAQANAVLLREGAYAARRVQRILLANQIDASTDTQAHQ